MSSIFVGLAHHRNRRMALVFARSRPVRQLKLCSDYLPDRRIVSACQEVDFELSSPLSEFVDRWCPSGAFRTKTSLAVTAAGTTSATGVAYKTGRIIWHITTSSAFPDNLRIKQQTKVKKNKQTNNTKRLQKFIFARNYSDKDIGPKMASTCFWVKRTRWVDL